MGKTLFVLVHLFVLHLITIAHPTCVFPSLVDNMHIVGPTLNVVFFFLQLQQEFSTLRLLGQPSMFVVWSPQKVGPLYVTSFWLSYF